MSQLKGCEGAVRVAWWKSFGPAAELALEREQRRHFRSQSSPGGAPWKPLAPLSLEIAAGQASQKVGGATEFSRTKSGVWKARNKRKPEQGEQAPEQRSATVRRTSKSRVLTDTGTLMRSLSAAGSSGAVRRMGINQLQFGTRLPYAKLHQFGGTFATTAKQRGYLGWVLGRGFGAKSLTWPTRPYLGVSAAGRTSLNRLAAAKMRQALKGAAQ